MILFFLAGPKNFRSASNFFGIAANPLQLDRGSHQLCMLTARYLDMTVGLYSGITLYNRKWAGLPYAPKSKTAKTIMSNYLRFPHVQIIDQQALKLSWWPFNSPAMHLRNLRVLALNKAEIMRISSDVDLFGVISLKQLFEFFPLWLYNTQHVAYQKKANCILLVILDSKLVSEWCRGTKGRIAIRPIYRLSIPVLFETTD